MYTCILCIYVYLSTSLSMQNLCIYIYIYMSIYIYVFTDVSMYVCIHGHDAPGSSATSDEEAQMFHSPQQFIHSPSVDL